jgi:protein-S-isoprenylcysteine O-methyltransferase Ste14
MKKAQQNDALLALISTLAVVFVVLFVSIAYFLTFRVGVNEREAYLNSQLQEMYSSQNRDNYGRVAGYQTEQ